MRTRSINITAVFAGIGGLELGLHRAGHRTSLFCECDPEATAVLSARFPGVPIALDVRRTDELLAHISDRSDLLTAGFPCTDLSQAGRTRGFAGGRSSLIRETMHILRKRPFPSVLIENVPNWRHLHGGAYFAEVIAALERMGYRWAYRTIDARSLGIPQRRKRIFLYATLEGDPRDVLFHGSEAEVPEEALALHQVAHGFYWTEGSRGLGWGEDCIPTLKGGSAIGIPAPPAILLSDLSVITPDIRDGERFQGFDADWTNVECLLPRFGSAKFNQRKRWLLVGNAVNVAVSTWIGQRLAQPRRYDGEPGAPLFNGNAWPEAAYFDGKMRRSSQVSAWPVRGERQSLNSFLQFPARLLSLRATSGFYARAKESRLRFAPGFLEAIQRHLHRMGRKTSVGVQDADRCGDREPGVMEFLGMARKPPLLIVDAATSERMKGIRRFGTRPEMLLRRRLWCHRIRYRCDNRDLPGSPDVANRSKRWAVFVHGCFWHGHTGCRAATVPKRNRKFWQEKIAANKRRDARKIKALRSQGFWVAVVWECALKRAERVRSETTITRLIAAIPRRPRVQGA